MALEEYAGAIVLEVDGKEVEVASVDATRSNLRKLVKTMNRTGRAKGFSRGMEEIALNVSVVIPLTGDIDWARIQGAKLTLYPIADGGQRQSYLDCFTTQVGDKYSVDNEARRDLQMHALRVVVE